MTGHDVRARLLEGLVKILAHQETDEILGVHMVGPRVSELIAEAAVAMEFHASAEDLALSDKLAEWEVPVMVAITKGDKLGRSKRDPQMQSILAKVGLPADQAVVTSAVTKEGVEDLQESILALAAEVRGRG